MRERQFHSFPHHSFPKGNSIGTGGISEMLMSTPTISLVPGTDGNGWEPVRTDESFRGVP